MTCDEYNTLVEEVYKQQVEALVYNYFCSVIDETVDGDKHFLKGFKEITQAKEKVKKLLDT